MLTIRCLMSAPQAAEAVAQIGHVGGLEFNARAAAIDARTSCHADASDNPRGDGASRILQLGQRAGPVPGIDPAAQRGRTGHKSDNKRRAIGPLRSVHSLCDGMGRDSPIRQ